MKIGILRILAEDKSLIVYRPSLRPLCGSVTGVLLFQQILYWFEKSGRKPFYKFREPCGHNFYKEGDSWAEELGFSTREIDHAIDLLCEKIKGKDLAKALQSSDKMVLYWTDIGRVTWFCVNENVAENRVSAIYVNDISAFTKTTNQQLPKQQKVSYVMDDLSISNTETTEITKITFSKEEKPQEKLAASPTPKFLNHDSNFSNHNDSDNARGNGKIEAERKEVTDVVSEGPSVKKKEKSCAKKKESVTLPFGEKFAAAWAEWETYRGKPYIRPKGPLSELVELSGNNESIAIAIMKQSQKKDWDGFYALKEDFAPKSKPNQAKPSHFPPKPADHGIKAAYVSEGLLDELL